MDFSYGFTKINYTNKLIRDGSMIKRKYAKAYAK